MVAVADTLPQLGAGPREVLVLENTTWGEGAGEGGAPPRGQT